MTEGNPKKMGELEALLFEYGEPVALKKAMKLLGVKEAEAESLLAGLSRNLEENESRGLTIQKIEDRVQLVTKAEFKKISEALIKEEFKEELSPASLETLSLIAYLGPVPRMTVDFIRGVNSSFILRSLLIRGLVERGENPERKNVYDYRVSFDFLKHIGLRNVAELPEYEKYKNILKQFDMKTGE